MVVSVEYAVVCADDVLHNIDRMRVTRECWNTRPASSIFTNTILCEPNSRYGCECCGEGELEKRESGTQKHERKPWLSLHYRIWLSLGTLLDFSLKSIFLVWPTLPSIRHCSVSNQIRIFPTLGVYTSIDLRAAGPKRLDFMTLWLYLVALKENS